ncbi:MAG TPA: hypothetical protein VGF92_04295 [Stellaceae bacterium]
MRSAIGAALSFLTWLAVLWTIYAEQNHLLLYVGDPEIAFGIGEFIDIAVAAVLLVYAIYEVFHFVGATGALDRAAAAHPALDALVLILLAALGWGIYRDITHFRHLLFRAEPFGDDADALAAIFLALGALKTGYHGVRALRALAHLTRS